MSGFRRVDTTYSKRYRNRYVADLYLSRDEVVRASGRVLCTACRIRDSFIICGSVRKRLVRPNPSVVASRY